MHLATRGLGGAGGRPALRWAAVSGLLVTSILVGNLGLAPSAVADSAGNFRAGLISLRAASCAPLRSDPVVEEASEIVNRSTSKYLDHTARTVPVPNPLPVMKELGYGGKNAKMLQGAGRTDAEAIKGALLEGYAAIPDCAYTDYGLSVLHNETTGLFLTVLVLARA
jgi:hypothetical protein